LGLTASGTFQQSTDASLATLVGTRWDLSDGREVVLVSTGSTTTTIAGTLYQDAALIANHQGLVVTAVQAYSNNGNTPATVTATLGGTAITANQYQGGFLYVQSSTGIGQFLRIAGNTAQTVTSGSTVVTLEDAPNVALTTSSVVSLVPAHGANVIVNPTTPTNTPVGVALYAISPSSYGFLVAKGLTAALSDSTAPAVGHAIASSTTTAGDIGAVAYTGSVVTGTVIGNTCVAAVSGAANLIYLNL
jgi:hypothetical protein